MSAAKPPSCPPNGKSMLRAVLVSLLLAAPAVAQAAERRFSYDAATPKARELTGAGLTLAFDQSLLGGIKLKTIHATAVSVMAHVTPADGRDERALLALLPSETGRIQLYQVDRGRDQGEVLARAFCPDSKRVWLAISPIVFSQPLTISALSEGGGGADGFRLCASMAFAWRGEWRLPPGREVAPPRPLTSGRGGG